LERGEHDLGAKAASLRRAWHVLARRINPTVKLVASLPRPRQFCR